MFDKDSIHAWSEWLTLHEVKKRGELIYLSEISTVLIYSPRKDCVNKRGHLICLICYAGKNLISIGITFKTQLENTTQNCGRDPTIKINFPLRPPRLPCKQATACLSPCLYTLPLGCPIL